MLFQDEGLWQAKKNKADCEDRFPAKNKDTVIKKERSTDYDSLKFRTKKTVRSVTFDKCFAVLSLVSKGLDLESS